MAARLPCLGQQACLPARLIPSRVVQSLRAALAGASGVIFAASGSGFWSAKGVDFEVRPGLFSYFLPPQLL